MAIGDDIWRSAISQAIGDSIRRLASLQHSNAFRNVWRSASGAGERRESIPTALLAPQPLHSYRCPNTTPCRRATLMPHTSFPTPRHTPITSDYRSQAINRRDKAITIY